AAALVVQGQVVLGVARRVDRGQRAGGVAVLEGHDPLGRGRRQAAVQRVEEVAVDAARGGPQPGGVDEGGGAAGGAVHGRGRGGQQRGRPPRRRGRGGCG